MDAPGVSPGRARVTHFAPCAGVIKQIVLGSLSRASGSGVCASPPSAVSRSPLAASSQYRQQAVPKRSVARPKNGAIRRPPRLDVWWRAFQLCRCLRSRHGDHAFIANPIIAATRADTSTARTGSGTSVSMSHVRQSVRRVRYRHNLALDYLSSHFHRVLSRTAQDLVAVAVHPFFDVLAGSFG